jgi:hypothetical protein
MQDPSEKELFLQNRFALSAVLLHQCMTVLSKNPSPQSTLLVIECENFFLETKALLFAEVAKENMAGNSSAKPAEESGAKFTEWKTNHGCQYPDHAENMEQSSSPEEVFSPPLSGGTPEMEPVWKSSLVSQMKIFFATKR